MSTDMAEDAADRFRKWFKKTDADTEGGVFDSLAGGYQEWLREGGGLRQVGEDYGLAVETLLLVISGPPLRPGLPPSQKDDPGAWDYMTETGFRFERRTFGRRRR